MSLIRGLSQIIVLAAVIYALTSGSANAVTAHARTSDWKFQQSSLYGVIYWADYNFAYGTTYYTITVGL